MALTQSDIDVEVGDLQDAYDKAVAEGAPYRTIHRATTPRTAARCCGIRNSRSSR